MRKTIDQLVEEAKKLISLDNSRSDSGYDSRYVEKSVPSDDKKAIAYKLKGSQWHRGGTYGGGVSYFEGISAYNGEVRLVVKPYSCYRAKYCHEDDIADILDFKSMGERRYEMLIGNDYWRNSYLVDFENQEVKRTSEKRLKAIIISGPEANDW
jgi:hypothetical protein